MWGEPFFVSHCRFYSSLYMHFFLLPLLHLGCASRVMTTDSDENVLLQHSWGSFNLGRCHFEACLRCGPAGGLRFPLMHGQDFQPFLLPPEKALDYLVVNAFKAMVNRPA
jgi:hypothetical protein